MTLSNEQLMLLEQLTYLNSAVAKAAAGGDSSQAAAYEGVTSSESVEVLLSYFDADKLKNLEEAGDISDTQGSEWAAIIRAIQDDEQLMSLNVVDAIVCENGKTNLICFEDPAEPSKAIVAFRGTLDAEEWVDNTEGAIVTDTDDQIAALNYIEGLSYDDITVVGHSKGGNKAQYVALLSDKVTRCVSMDGQGFSQEFYEKYWAEVEEKADIITNISVNIDYVHAILFPVPGSTQLYCEGGGIEDVRENHAQNSFFQYTTNSDGESVISYDESGALVVYTEENVAITELHEFISFLMNVMDDEDKEQVIEMLELVLYVTMGGETLSIDGVTYDKENVMDLIMLDEEAMIILLAYTFKYIDTYDLSTEEIVDLLEVIGYSDLIEEIEESFLGKAGFYIGIGILDATIETVFDYIINRLDDQDNWVVDQLLSLIFPEIMYWEELEEKYQSIGNINVSTANQNITVKTGEIRNFSKQTYNSLIDGIVKFEADLFGDLSSWGNYATEDWYSGLMIGTTRSGIQAYADKITEINNECKTKIQTVFGNEWEIDASTSSKMQNYSNDIKDVVERYKILIDCIAL